MPPVIVQLIDQQTSEGQTIENVFHFVDPDGVASVTDLLTEYVGQVIPLVVHMQVAGCSHVNIRYRQVYPTDTLMLDYATGLPVAGVDVDAAAPSYEALSFKWLLSNPTVTLSGGFTGHLKRGGCRIGGIPQNIANGNLVTAGFILAGRNWSDEVRHPGEGGWQLCVASYLIGNPVKPVPPAKHAVPRDVSPTVTAYSIVGGATDPGPSTQNTRKFLRGIAS